MGRRQQSPRDGRQNRKPSRAKRWLVRLLVIVLVLVTAQIIHQVFQDEEKAVRTRIRQFITGQFPDATAQIKTNYGIKPYPAHGTASGSGHRKPDIVLVHGLDDPGRVWMNLAPRLAREGFRVWIMSYPNDQPIGDSAEAFLEAMAGLRKKGVASVDVVAHSMGGLVTREMLTNPKLEYHKKTASGDTPAVNRFIMVGTPNHGSQLARFRLLAEARDQLVLLWQHKHHWLQSVVDGAGEAGIDLLPGSQFLESLNRRPPPPRVKMLVIAGMLAPWQVRDIEIKIDSARQRVHQREEGILDTLDGHLRSMANGIGDGLVTVDSARLPGVPLRIVSGTHISIIRNLTEDNPREPPAIPIILDDLSGLENGGGL